MEGVMHWFQDAGLTEWYVFAVTNSWRQNNCENLQLTTVLKNWKWSNPVHIQASFDFNCHYITEQCCDSKYDHLMVTAVKQ